MSTSVYNEPSRLDGLLQECLPAILLAHPGQDPWEVTLTQVSADVYSRQRGNIPHRLAALVEESSSGTQTIRRVDPVIIDGYTLAQSVYFVRCSSYNGEVEPITKPSSDMVLFEINPHRARLVVSKPFTAEDTIESVLAERAAEHAARSRSMPGMERRHEVSSELDRIIDRIEFYLEHAEGDDAARQKWRHVQQRRQVNTEITLQDILTVCSFIGIDLATLATHPPASRETTS